MVAGSTPWTPVCPPLGLRCTVLGVIIRDGARHGERPACPFARMGPAKSLDPALRRPRTRARLRGRHGRARHRAPSDRSPCRRRHLACCRDSRPTASFTTTLSALCILFVFGTGETFVTVGAAALMANAAFGIALVRPAGWVAATLGVMTLLLYSIVVLLFDVGGVAVFQALLLVSLLSGA